MLSRPKPRSKYLMICGWCEARGESEEAATFNPYQPSQNRGPERDCACPAYVYAPPKRRVTQKAT